MMRARWRSRGGSLVDEDRNEDQIVDAKHDLQQDERAKSEPTRGISNPFHPLRSCVVVIPQHSRHLTHGTEAGYFVASH